MYLVMDESTANGFESLTDGRDHRLDPRLIEGGEHAGKYALPIAVKEDPEFGFILSELDLVPTHKLDPAEAFPEGDDGN